MKKDTSAPKLITAECKDTDLLELTFDRVLDNVTAEDTSIYSIDGIDIRSAELDSTNTKVRLSTSGIQSGHSYELKIRGIKNGDGVTTKSITKKFTGRKDTTAPKLNKLTALNNIRLRLEFSDSNGLDKAIAQRRDNYSITSKDGGLEVESVEVKDADEDGLWDTVEVVTETQDSGEEYTLIIEEIADASIAGNKTTREIKREFKGKSKDKSGPTIARSPIAVTNTMVEVEFEDANALDIESACDIGNYTIEEGLYVLEARIKDKDDLYSADGRTVLLTTSEMEKSESYTLEISGILDEFGNEMKTSSSSGYKKSRFKGVAEDRTPPYITFVECINSKTIELNFDNLLDEESAETVTNYRVDGLAIATKAVLQEDGKTVRLTVSSLSSDINHKILLNNIEDLSGNAMSNVSVGILYNGNPDDNDPPEVDYIEAMNNKEVWICFEEEIYAENARMEASGVSFEQVGYVLDDGTTVVMKASSTMDDDEYEVTRLSGIWDLRNNYYELEDDLEFYGTNDGNDPPEVDDWDQMDARRFRVIFTEPVLLTDDHEVSGIKNPSGVSIKWKAVLNPDKEDTDDAYSTVDYIATDKNIPADKEFRFNFTDMVHDYSGTGVLDEDDHDYGASGSTVLESYIEDDEEPYIDYVEALTRKKAQITFSEEIRDAGRYKITYQDDYNKLRVIDISLIELDSKDKTKVNLYTEDEMTDDYYYILEPLSAAVDTAGNKLDIDDLEIDFEGSNLMSSDYIQGVEVLTADTLRVSKSSEIYSGSKLYELDEAGNAIGENLIHSGSRVSDNVYKVKSKKPLLRDVRYKITVDGLEYKFYGAVQTGGLELELGDRKITYDHMNLNEHNVRVFRADGNELDVDEEGGHFEIDGSESLRNGEKLYIYVERQSDKMTLYGIRIKIEGMPTASSSKEITGFSFKGLDPDVVGNIENDNTIRLEVPYETDLTNLIASFSYSDNAVVKIGSITQVSGKTTNDYTHEVTYTVIAQDGTKKNYTVRVTKDEHIYEKEIKSFTFDSLEPAVSGSIDQGKQEISLTVPFGTDITSLKPIISTSKDTTVSPDTGETQDFSHSVSDPVIYRVKAPDGSFEEYKVKVFIASEMDKSIEAFKFEQLEPVAIGTIDERTSKITVTVPYNTEVTELVPTIIVPENTVVIPAAGKAYDFSGDDPVIFVVKAADGSKKEYSVTVKKSLSAAKSITSFSLRGIEGKIDENTKSITLTVPYGTQLTNLRPTFTVSPGAVVKVGEVEQVSGETGNNFRNPVIYTVVAQNKTEEYYEVAVSTAPSTEKEMKEFSFVVPAAAGVIDEAAKSINVKVPYGTNVTDLKAVFRCSDKSTVKVNDSLQKSGETGNDFTKPVIYTVIAQDGSRQNYTVTVIPAADSSKQMTSFAFSGLTPAVQGDINQENLTIKLMVPEGTILTDITASFTFSGKSVEAKAALDADWIPQISGVTKNDFSKTIVYRVTADDGTMVIYTVMVTFLQHMP
ncbi:MAG TPA: hypothetical protein VD757_02440 [Candidatus Nitrosocosmicus sp.]|nr:hypothetical protein [Candidatus Nitrosocosmicus sp.]